MDVPTDVDMSEYLRTYPQIPQDLPQVVTNFFMRVEMPLDGPGQLVLQELLSDSRKPDSVSVILDYEMSFSAMNIGADAELWSRINRLRTLKNQIFRACVTPRLEDTFKQWQ